LAEDRFLHSWHEVHTVMRLRRDAHLKLAKALKVKPEDLA
jgi:hypothetical protein